MLLRQPLDMAEVCRRPRAAMLTEPPTQCPALLELLRQLGTRHLRPDWITLLSTTAPSPVLRLQADVHNQANGAR
jgi:hypothetical protein